MLLLLISLCFLFRSYISSCFFYYTKSVVIGQFQESFFLISLFWVRSRGIRPDVIIVSYRTCSFCISRYPSVGSGNRSMGCSTLQLHNAIKCHHESSKLNVYYHQLLPVLSTFVFYCFIFYIIRLV